MIPTRLLVHTVLYKTPTGKVDRSGKPTYTDELTLDKVRVEATIGVTTDGQGLTKADSMTLYYVPFYSNPQIVPEENALVTWNGKTYTIKKVHPLYTQGNDAVHHYEAELV